MGEYYIHKQYRPNSLRFFGVMSLILAIFMIYGVISSERSFLEYNELLFSKGNLTLKPPPNKYATGIYFSHSNSENEFVYITKSGDMKKVRELINTGLIVKVGYRQNDSGVKTVYDLEIDGKKIKSYEAIRTAHKHDNRVVFILAPWFIFSFITLFWMANNHKKKIANEIN